MTKQLGLHIVNFNCHVYFAGVLASICVQENIALLYNFCKTRYNIIPKTYVIPDLVDDLTLDKKEQALDRISSNYNTKIVDSVLPIEEPFNAIKDNEVSPLHIVKQKF